jgi:adenosylhomocysteine nucleosidase
VTIGVICAIPQELAHLRGVLSGGERHEIAHITFDVGELDGHRVVLAAAGMGFADRFHCRAVVFTGVAGGLDPELRIGDIVIADRVVQHDFGLIQDERLHPCQPGHMPFIKPTERLGYAVGPELIDRVKRHLEGIALPALSTAATDGGRPPRISYGTILTGDQYLHCERTRSRLHDEFGGLAIEMEGGALLDAAAGQQVPQ